MKGGWRKWCSEIRFSFCTEPYCYDNGEAISSPQNIVTLVNK